MRTLGGEVVGAGHPFGGSLSEAFTADCVAVLLCCTAPCVTVQTRGHSRGFKARPGRIRTGSHESVMQVRRPYPGELPRPRVNCNPNCNASGADDHPVAGSELDYSIVCRLVRCRNSDLGNCLCWCWVWSCLDGLVSVCLMHERQRSGARRNLVVDRAGGGSCSYTAINGVSI